MEEKVRNWYLTNMPERCVKITDRRSNWIGTEVGVKYYSPSSRPYARLYLGDDIYVYI